MKATVGLEVDKKVSNKTKRKTIPKELIYEMVKGRPVYYREYDKVLTGEKTLEEVMGSSFLQGLLIDLILKFLHELLDYSKYLITTNETGFKFKPKSWRLLDIAIFERVKVKEEMFSSEYVKTSPKIVIEIDTKADLRKYGDIINYINEKTDDLLNSGVEKVLWILTKDKKVMVAEKDKHWIITNWNEDIKILEDIYINVDKLIHK